MKITGIRTHKIKSISAILIIVGMVGCLDPYMPPEVENVSEFLVVDALLNIGDGSCEVILKRTIPLNSSSNVSPRESLATVTVNTEGGSAYTLVEVEPGKYVTNGIPIDLNAKYSVSIRTFNGNEYSSEMVAATDTPPIDSVTWKTTGKENFSVYVHTHDDNKQPGYYMWRYLETWTYHSAFQSTVKYENGEMYYRLISEYIYNCWGNDYSNEIIIASTSKLERNLITDHLVASHEIGDQKLQSRYSIGVMQYSLTKEAFEYWKELQKNTENLGTIFDPQPSQLTGNFTCTSDPSEPVLGYFSATSVQTKRIFVNRRELPQVMLSTQYDNCVSDVVPLNGLSTAGGLFIRPISTPTGIIIGYERSTTFCVDCREAGGTTIKPDFWE